MHPETREPQPDGCCRYTIELVMEEENPDIFDCEHRDVLQNAFTGELRGGAFAVIADGTPTAAVLAREVLATAPAGNPEHDRA
jgi:hypothetical protein